MLRKFLTVVLPIALPFIVYFIYVALARRRGVKLDETPWAWLTAGGVVLLAATWYIDPIFDELRGVAAQAADVPGYIETVLPSPAGGQPEASAPAAATIPTTNQSVIEG